MITEQTDKKYSPLNLTHPLMRADNEFSKLNLKDLNDSIPYKKKLSKYDLILDQGAVLHPWPYLI